MENIFIDGVNLVKEITEIPIFIAITALILVFVLGGLALRYLNKGFLIATVTTGILFIALSICQPFRDNLGISVPTGKYIVTLDGSADMDEFFCQYNIIEINDGKYTIEIRKEAENKLKLEEQEIL